MGNSMQTFGRTIIGIFLNHSQNCLIAHCMREYPGWGIPGYEMLIKTPHRFCTCLQTLLSSSMNFQMVGHPIGVPPVPVYQLSQCDFSFHPCFESPYHTHTLKYFKNTLFSYKTFTSTIATLSYIGKVITGVIAKLGYFKGMRKKILVVFGVIQSHCILYTFSHPCVIVMISDHLSSSLSDLACWWTFITYSKSKEMSRKSYKMVLPLVQDVLIVDCYIIQYFYEICSIQNVLLLKP